jgi:hypothetical protein
MSLTKTVGLFAGTTLVLSGVAFASTEADNAALQQIAELKAEIAAMKAANGENWLTEQRAAEIKGLVQDVLADADTRSSLQGQGATSGWDNGFFLASADGNFRLNIEGGAQVRFSLNHRDDQTQFEETTNWGFGLRNVELAFSGHIVDPSWQYRVGIQFYQGNEQPDADGSAQTTDVWILKDFGGLYIRAGQFYAPFSRERMLSDYNLQFVDRSNTAYVFGLGRTQGAEVGYISDAFRVAAAYTNSLSNDAYANGAYYPPANAPLSDFAVSGRAEIKFAGTWKQFEYQQSFRGEEFKFLVGLGGYYQNGRNNYTPGVDGGGNNYGFVVDAAAGFGGFNLYGAWYWVEDDGFTNQAIDSTTNGLLVEGGFFLTDDIELVGRWEYGDLDNLVPLDLQSTFGVGVNWYFMRNRLKWQSDVNYAYQSMGTDGFAVSSNGWYGDAPGANGQWLIRSQISFNF